MAAISLILCTYALIQKYQSAQIQEEKEQNDTISVTLSTATEKTIYRKLEPIVIKITIKNNGLDAVGILKWHTPAEAVEIPCLNVLYRKSGNVGMIRAMEEVDYQGPLKVIVNDDDDGTPDADDYYIVPSGETLDMDIDLLLFYDLFSAGLYHVKYNNDLTSFVSNTITFTISD